MLGVVGYLGVAHTLRWRRYNDIHRRYQAKFENDTLTVEEAQEVVQLSLFYDMPSVPTVSKLLLSTKEFSTVEKVSRRYIDSNLLRTTLLTATWMGCPITGHTIKKEGNADPRANIAVARVNWLHSRYKISNDDYLYTLSLFIAEPAVWSRLCGWRPFSPLEEYATFVYWAEIGRRMGIKDIPDTLEGLKRWAQRYEEGYMVPADENRKVADLTTDELLSCVPERFGLKRLGEKISFHYWTNGQPEQPWYIHALVSIAMSSFAFVMLWSLPRKEGKLPVTIKPPPPVPGVCPRLHPNRYPSKPWYRPEPTGVWYIITWLSVKLGYFSSMPGPNLKSKGYRLEEIGPLHLENAGHEEVMKAAEELQGYPITGPWSLVGRI
ncbi:hypothetical protein BDQ17DRAFT_1353818 [Cyathus striatus]|nr:hypothetical protein BDQ17DRAFT_1353818 [Cyathus striatus]